MAEADKDVKAITDAVAAVSLTEEKKPRWGKLDDPRSPSDVLGTVQRFKVFFSVRF